MPKRILVLFAHPALEKSRVNRVLADAVRDLPWITFHDLYERYPHFGIDVRREQEQLVAHDVVVLQHPFYWYSAPALVKEWLDLVLEYGWAYGHEGTALHGRVMLNATTTGAREDAYRADGKNRFTMRELLAPFDQSAHLCGMRYIAPFVVHSALRMSATADVARSAAHYRAALEALRDDAVDLAAAASAERLNDLVPQPVMAEPTA